MITRFHCNGLLGLVIGKGRINSDDENGQEFFHSKNREVMMLIKFSITNDKLLQVKDLVVITLKILYPFENFVETLNVIKEIANITCKLCRYLLQKDRFNK
jgi:hypothetical protein